MSSQTMFKLMPAILKYMVPVTCSKANESKDSLAMLEIHCKNLVASLKITGYGYQATML